MSTATPRIVAHIARRRLRDRCARLFLLTLAGITALIIVALLGYVCYLGSSAISWQFLTGMPSDRTSGGGIGPEIYNSFYLLFLTLVFTVPIALGAAIYLHEYARPGAFPQWIEFASDVLATVPSIVMGLFGLLVFVYTLRWRFTALGGALTLTLLNVPSMLRIAGDALRNVPLATREASLALGATRWYTIRRAVLPSAAPSLISGIVLISGRIFGETAALIYTAGVGIETAAPYSLAPFHPAETLSVHLWYAHAESLVPDVARVANGSAFVLVAMVVLFNLAARGLGVLLTSTRKGRAT